MTAYDTWRMANASSGGPKYTAEQRHAIKAWCVRMPMQGEASDPEGWVYVAARDNLVRVMADDYWPLVEQAIPLYDSGCRGLALYNRLVK